MTQVEEVGEVLTSLDDTLEEELDNLPGKFGSYS